MPESSTSSRAGFVLRVVARATGFHVLLRAGVADGRDVPARAGTSPAAAVS